MTPYHFTPADYDKIVEAARKSDEWREDFDDSTIERLSLTLDAPRVNIDLTRYISGDLDHGDRSTPPYFEVTGESYEVTYFALFDEEDNDIHSDFDGERLADLLNWGAQAIAVKWFGRHSA